MDVTLSLVIVAPGDVSESESCEVTWNGSDRKIKQTNSPSYTHTVYIFESRTLVRAPCPSDGGTGSTD